MMYNVDRSSRYCTTLDPWMPAIFLPIPRKQRIIRCLRNTELNLAEKPVITTLHLYVFVPTPLWVISRCNSLNDSLINQILKCPNWVNWVGVPGLLINILLSSAVAVPTQIKITRIRQKLLAWLAHWSRENVHYAVADIMYSKFPVIKYGVFSGGSTTHNYFLLKLPILLRSD